MGVDMEYQGPTSDDLVNINALNRAYLRLATQSDWPGPGNLFRRRLSVAERERLSSAPFLLFSFRETDDEFWHQVIEDQRQVDMIDAADRVNEQAHGLQVAGLGFLWELSRRSPYVARIVTGAPVAWCEQLASETLVNLLEKAAHRADLVTPRFPTREGTWRRLLQGGTSESHQVRLMSQQSALQALLTRGQPASYDPVAAAACRFKAPQRSVVERRANGIRET